jgi:hypothetical protein
MVRNSDDAAEQTVAKLRDTSFDVTKLSIVGKNHTEESVVGYDATWERMKYWACEARFGAECGGCSLEPAFF